MSKALGVDVRNVHYRRRRLEKRLGCPLFSQSAQSPDRHISPDNTFICQNEVSLRNGTIVAFTDAHIFPGVRTTAQRALLKHLPDLKADLVLDNGDSFDGGQVSRHSRIGWDRRPTVQEELEANQDFHDEVRKRSRGAKRFWNWGNHDQRYPTKLASQVPEFIGVKGFRLEDHFPEWKFGVTLTINPDLSVPLLMKHRYHGGVHADWNNVVKAGIHIYTGHDHQMTARPFINKRGRFFGIRGGTLSDIGLPIFDYQEGNPSQQQAGYTVLRFHEGTLLWPRFCTVLFDERGKPTDYVENIHGTVERV